MGNTRIEDLVRNWLDQSGAKDVVGRQLAYEGLRKKVGILVAKPPYIHDQSKSAALYDLIEKAIKDIEFEHQVISSKPPGLNSGNRTAKGGGWSSRTKLFALGGFVGSCILLYILILSLVSYDTKPLVAGLRNLNLTSNAFEISGPDPQIHLNVPDARGSKPSNLRFVIETSIPDEIEIFLPDPKSKKDSFQAKRSIIVPVAAGRHEISQQLPAYVSGRTIRLDPGAGTPGVKAKISQIAFESE